MYLQMLVDNIQLYLLIFARIYAMMRTAPLLSSASVPRVIHVGLTGFCAVTILPWLLNSAPAIPEWGLAFVMLILGELLIGLIMGFFISLIYSAFQIAGEFFSLQMGFGASQVFDPLAQIEIPIMGQFLNLIAMYVFIAVGGLRDLFFKGVYASFKAISAAELVGVRNSFFSMLFNGFTGLFMQAIIIALPILGTLFLMSLSMGLLAKAAPQMNLLMLGFPINITVAFLMIFVSLPFIAEVFAKVIDMSFETLMRVMDGAMRAGGAS